MTATTHRIPGLVLTDRRLDIPLDHADPSGPTISVFAREVASPTAAPDLPYPVFPQGRPGFALPQPACPPPACQWWYGWPAAMHSAR